MFLHKEKYATNFVTYSFAKENMPTILWHVPLQRKICQQSCGIFLRKEKYADNLVIFPFAKENMPIIL
jgi:hypothetical protein